MSASPPPKPAIQQSLDAFVAAPLLDISVYLHFRRSPFIEAELVDGIGRPSGPALLPHSDSHLPLAPHQKQSFDAKRSFRDRR